MPEIAPAFRRIERPNVRSDTSVQSFDCSLGSLAQESLQGMEHQLDGVKVGRILRQEAEACTNSPDRLLHTGNLMEGHVIDGQVRRLLDIFTGAASFESCVLRPTWASYS